MTAGSGSTWWLLTSHCMNPKQSTITDEWQVHHFLCTVVAEKVTRQQQADREIDRGRGSGTEVREGVKPKIPSGSDYFIPLKIHPCTEKHTRSI